MQDLDNLTFDAKHIWHPYSSAKQPGQIHEVISAKGVYLTLNDGRKVMMVCHRGGLPFMVTITLS